MLHEWAPGTSFRCPPVKWAHGHTLGMKMGGVAEGESDNTNTAACFFEGQGQRGAQSPQKAHSPTPAGDEMGSKVNEIHIVSLSCLNHSSLQGNRNSVCMQSRAIKDVMNLKAEQKGRREGELSVLAQRQKGAWGWG